MPGEVPTGVHGPNFGDVYQGYIREVEAAEVSTPQVTNGVKVEVRVRREVVDPKLPESDIADAVEVYGNLSILPKRIEE